MTIYRSILSYSNLIVLPCFTVINGIMACECVTRCSHRRWTPTVRAGTTSSNISRSRTRHTCTSRSQKQRRPLNTAEDPVKCNKNR